MTRRLVALVRHGETEWNASGRFQGRVDVGLNEAGDRQASAAAERLRSLGRDWRAIASSPLLRARQTAARIDAAVGVGTIAIDLALIERSFGDAEGVAMLEASQRWPDGNFPGAESEDALLQRTREAWSRVLDSDGDTIVVCHVAVIRALVQSLCAVDPGHVPNGAVLFLEIEHEVRLLA